MTFDRIARRCTGFMASWARSKNIRVFEAEKENPWSFGVQSAAIRLIKTSLGNPGIWWSRE